MMDQAQARALLAAERARLQRLLQAETGEPEAAELGDEVDDADRRNTEQTGMAVDQLLRARWAALVRAEARLAAGSYGHSVRSGQPIPDERLEADPLAELTAQEAAAAERQALEEDEPPPAPSPGIHIERDNWLVVKGFKPSPITIGSAEPNVAA
jgi:DnaK suppressor protein